MNGMDIIVLCRCDGIRERYGYLLFWYSINPRAESTIIAIYTKWSEYVYVYKFDVDVPLGRHDIFDRPKLSDIYNLTATK